MNDQILYYALYQVNILCLFSLWGVIGTKYWQSETAVI